LPIQNQKSKIQNLTLTPIGVIHTPHKERGDAPRQAESSSGRNEGRIVLFPGHNFEQALLDLTGFECIWIISWFHQNSTWRPKVTPPRGGKQRRGVFATRSPYRPNPIGLSRATLLEVRGRTLRVRDTDLLDGTPILDIKPYLPYADAAPDARVGWMEEHTEGGLKAHALEWSPLAREQLDLLKEFGVDLETTAQRVLEMDVEPHDYRRITKRPDGKRLLAIKSWRLIFSVKGRAVRIERIHSGYALERILHHPGEELSHGDAHVEFYRRWPEGLEVR